MGRWPLLVAAAVLLASQAASQNATYATYCDSACQVAQSGALYQLYLALDGPNW